jgi:hypothetical protein
MTNVHKFSERVIDLAERLEDVADAAAGKGARSGRSGVRWLVLPTVGAGMYALVTNRSFGRQAKGVIDGAKKRASELPEDLLKRARTTTQRQPSRSTSRNGRTSSSSRKPTRKASSARASSSSR